MYLLQLSYKEQILQKRVFLFKLFQNFIKDLYFPRFLHQTQINNQDMQEQNNIEPQININKISADFDQKMKIVQEHQNYSQSASEHQNNSHCLQNIGQKKQSSIQSKLTILEQRYASQIKKFLICSYQQQDFQLYKSYLYNDNIILQHQGVIGIRKLLSVACNPPIQRTIDAGIIPKLIELVKQNQFPQLQLQALWALTNVCYGDKTQCLVVINEGAIPLFIDLLKSPYLAIVQTTIWTLGNVSGDTGQLRDIIIQNDGIKKLVETIKNNMNILNIVNNGSWALSNLCRGNPLPSYSKVKQAVAFIYHLIISNQIQSLTAVGDCFWAIVKQYGPSKHQFSQQQGQILINRILNILNKNLNQLLPQDAKDVILAGSLKLLSEILNDNQCLIISFLSQDFVKPFLHLLKHQRGVIREQTCFILAIVTSFSNQNNKNLWKQNDLLLQLLKMLNCDSVRIRSKILRFFSNMPNIASISFAFQLYKQHQIILYYVITLLESQDQSIAQTGLQCLVKIFEVGDQVKGKHQNYFLKIIQNPDIIQIIQKLQYHKSLKVYQLSANFLEKYFNCDQFEQNYPDQIQSEDKKQGCIQYQNIEMENQEIQKSGQNKNKTENNENKIKFMQQKIFSQANQAGAGAEPSN